MTPDLPTWPPKPRYEIGWFVCVALAFVVAISNAGDVLFAPGPEIETAIIKHYDGAKKSIKVQLYNFTDRDIAAALCRAAFRGVKVEVLLDNTAAHQKGSMAKTCHEGGCKVWVDNKHPIAHGKVRIIDDAVVLAGSYNNSARAARNAENMTIEDSRATVDKYLADFREHKSHAIPYAELMELEK